MFRYKKLRKILVYPVLAPDGITVVNKPREVNCDGWYFFNLPIYTRENV